MGINPLPYMERDKLMGATPPPMPSVDTDADIYAGQRRVMIKLGFAEHIAALAGTCEPQILIALQKAHTATVQIEQERQQRELAAEEKAEADAWAWEQRFLSSPPVRLRAWWYRIARRYGHPHDKTDSMQMRIDLNNANFQAADLRAELLEATWLRWFFEDGGMDKVAPTRGIGHWVWAWEWYRKVFNRTPTPCYHPDRRLTLDGTTEPVRLSHFVSQSVWAVFDPDETERRAVVLPPGLTFNAARAIEEDR